MPAFVNSKVGSSPGTTGLDGTTVWPFDSKNFRNVERISEAFIVDAAPRARRFGQDLDFGRRAARRPAAGYSSFAALDGRPPVSSKFAMPRRPCAGVSSAIS